MRSIDSIPDRRRESQEPVGLEPALAAHLGGREAPDSEPGMAPLAGEYAALLAENRELRAEIDRLRTERAPLVTTQQQVMQLLGTRSPERILHDLRNVLNDNQLLKTLVDLEG